MKKSKVILAIALAVILLVTLMNVPTFSWFTRPQPSATDLNSNSSAQSGDELKLVNKNSYKQYNGRGVTAVTKSSTTGQAAPTDTYTTTCSDSASLSASSTAIPVFNRKYFCTTITNSSGTEQNVSLYAHTLSIPTDTNGTLALGVNGPTRSYRDYTSLATPTKKTSANYMRVYFQKPKDNPVAGWTGTEFYICWTDDPDTDHEILNSTGSNGTYYKMTYCGESSGFYNYFVDIPKNATHAFFACENWGTNNNGSENWGQRTQTLWNLEGDGQTQRQSKVYTLSSTTNSSGNHLVRTDSPYPYSVDGACINTYYDKIFVGTANFNAALASSEYSTNGAISYESTNTSIFNVTSSGVISPVASGEAILRTTITGASFGDTQVVETTVHVTMSANYVFNDVPIVHNIKIPATTENSANVVKVYWYVINNSTTTGLRYTIDEIYVGL